MRKTFFLFTMGTFFLFPCFSQNMIILGGEYNFIKPQFWSAGLGFNFIVLNEHLQNDFTVNFGGILPKEINTADDPRQKFLFSIRDGFYFSWDWKWVGLRAGVFASWGIYDIDGSSKTCDMSFIPGGFVGLSLFPKSLFSVVIDVCPGYLFLFRINEGFSFSKNESGFSLPLFLGIRFNMDKL
jgi:hypothetical protein